MLNPSCQLKGRSSVAGVSKERWLHGGRWMRDRSGFLMEIAPVSALISLISSFPTNNLEYFSLLRQYFVHVFDLLILPDTYLQCHAILFSV